MIKTSRPAPKTSKVIVRAILLLASASLAVISAHAAPVVDVFGDAKLHHIEQQIVTLAQESRKDISYQDHQKLLDTVSEKIVGGMSDVSSLATLAIWANLNCCSNELENGNINYNHVIRTARDAAICKLGASKDGRAEETLWRVAHQMYINGRLSEELCEAMSNITKKEFRFGDRVYVRLKDQELQKLPMSPENATFRVALCEELWKHWKSPVAGSVDLCVRATFVIDSDRQITNMKVVPIYFGRQKNQAAALQFQEAARSTLEHCSIQEPLPNGMTKVHMEVDFYGH